MIERLESTSITAAIDELISSGERVLTLMTWTAEGQGSGATGVLRPGVIYEFEGELVKHTRFFLDQARARQEFERE